MRPDARVPPPKRLRLLVAWLALIVATTGCSGAERRHRHRPDPDGEGPTVKSAAPPRRPFPGLRELVALPAVAQLRTVHPVGDLEATIRANEAASGYGKRGRAPMPEGAVIMESLSVDASSTALTHYVMRRREAGYFPEGGDWDYAVVDKDGAIEAEGKLRLCARCHAEAAREHLFEPLGPP